MNWKESVSLFLCLDFLLPLHCSNTFCPSSAGPKLISSGYWPLYEWLALMCGVWNRVSPFRDNLFFRDGRTGCKIGHSQMIVTLSFDHETYHLRPLLNVAFGPQWSVCETYASWDLARTHICEEKNICQPAKNANGNFALLRLVVVLGIHCIVTVCLPVHDTVTIV